VLVEWRNSEVERCHFSTSRHSDLCKSDSPSRSLLTVPYMLAKLRFVRTDEKLWRLPRY